MGIYEKRNRQIIPGRNIAYCHRYFTIVVTIPVIKGVVFVKLVDFIFDMMVLLYS
jgi:hypothetical protein